MPEASTIGRDAFVYLEPRAGTDEAMFAECGACRMFVPEVEGLEGSRCIIHGSYVDLDEDDSCALFVPWPTQDGTPNAKVVADHAAELAKGITGSVTTVESGFVDHEVQCHRCRFAKREATRCGLYEKINLSLPNTFSLDPNIKPNACCNAQMPVKVKRSLYSGKT